MYVCVCVSQVRDPSRRRRGVPCGVQEPAHGGVVARTTHCDGWAFRHKSRCWPRTRQLKSTAGGFAGQFRAQSWYCARADAAVLAAVLAIQWVAQTSRACVVFTGAATCDGVATITAGADIGTGIDIDTNFGTSTRVDATPRGCPLGGAL